MEGLSHSILDTSFLFKARFCERYKKCIPSEGCLTRNHLATLESLDCVYPNDECIVAVSVLPYSLQCVASIFVMISVNTLVYNESEIPSKTVRATYQLPIIFSDNDLLPGPAGVPCESQLNCKKT